MGEKIVDEEEIKPLTPRIPSMRLSSRVVSGVGYPVSLPNLISLGRKEGAWGKPIPIRD
jgi:hypothetical protein